ncbi:MAG TPA: restriction endonuclease subunit S, partial [Tissierellaceae bacterium]|nr:restriction endonuclease subunit S [Tissierellaceae bacterium]
MKEEIRERIEMINKGQVPEGYKKTKVGIIPEDWEESFLENLCDISTGDKDTKDRKEDGKYPFFVRSNNVESIDSYSYDGEAILTAGDGVGTGKVFHYVNGKFDYHQRVYCLREFRDINGKYLYYYFSWNFIKQVVKYSAKTSVDSVRKEMLTK